jgi:hypothetical protein
VDLKREDVFGFQPQRHANQCREAAREKRGSDDQGSGRPHVDDHEHVAHPACESALRR